MRSLRELLRDVNLLTLLPSHSRITLIASAMLAAIKRYK